VDIHVRQRMAHDRVGVAAQGRERERIRRGAVEHEEDVTIGFERALDGVDRGACPVVGTIAPCVPAIGRFQRTPRLGADCGVVVAAALGRKGLWRRHFAAGTHSRSPTQSLTDCSALGNAAGFDPPACAMSARPPPLPPTCCATWFTRSPALTLPVRSLVTPAMSVTRPSATLASTMAALFSLSFSLS